MIKILLAEDDEDFGYILKKYLEMNNFTVFHKTNGKNAWEFFKNNNVDFCILDIMMPESDGFELATKIKSSKPSVPFLFLTAKNLKEDIIKGLKTGADDYITKPFEAEELLLRIKNIIARSKNELPDEYKFAEYTFFYDKAELHYKNEIKTLTALEADLLKILLQNKNKIVDRKVILKELWSEADYFTSRSMDVFISRLRKYLEKDKSVE
ncbi:MAG: response regulator transcription factor, partial [Chlorobi bacterium]|nr:response regulator transcription factor [Chlorobiota bacterium]